MRFMLLFSRQGKLRLQKWYLAMSDKERKKMVRELMQVVLARKPKMCSFLEWRDLKVVYKRYASLYFCCAIEGQDNELITLELIHRYVELLDKYFGSVCELDIIFNFEKAYFILDEFLMGGDVQDTSKKSVLKAIEQADLLQEEDESPESAVMSKAHWEGGDWGGGGGRGRCLSSLVGGKARTKLPHTVSVQLLYSFVLYPVLLHSHLPIIPLKGSGSLACNTMNTLLVFNHLI
ncbi:AP-1 complex subunit sigma-1A isoform X1 [Sarcophilus harrisii]|nr:AP-1 complex subunit sigma-1A isoform X1 [Sarcophilus harrisii]XP_031821220.1 AP-1 complex subunit sigma-1A isoform X1 [Sarcophilus harrisii]